MNFFDKKLMIEIMVIIFELSAKKQKKAKRKVIQDWSL